MFYDRQSHCFRAHRLLPVSKKSRIPVPLGSRRDPWKDWEEDFRELCDAEATVTQQTWANERLTSWEKDFDVVRRLDCEEDTANAVDLACPATTEADFKQVCGLDCAFEDVAFSSKAIEHDYCDDQTLPSASVDDYLSTSTNESHDCIQRPCDCISSIATTVSTTEVSNNDPESQQTTDPPLTPKFDPDSVLGSSETQQNTDENPQQNIEAILLPEIKEDALGPNRIALQMKSSSLLYDINPQKGSSESERMGMTSNSMAMVPTLDLELTNTPPEDDIYSETLEIEHPIQDLADRVSKPPKKRTMQHSSHGARFPIFESINRLELTNERTAAVLGLEVWRNFWSKPD
ncbi:hypothetical protein IWX49DRAFT_554606 [Phyllosticta citricarpa]